MHFYIFVGRAFAHYPCQGFVKTESPYGENRFNLFFTHNLKTKQNKKPDTIIIASCSDQTHLPPKFSNTDVFLSGANALNLLPS